MSTSLKGLEQECDLCERVQVRACKKHNVTYQKLLEVAFSVTGTGTGPLLLERNQLLEVGSHAHAVFNEFLLCIHTSGFAMSLLSMSNVVFVFLLNFKYNFNVFNSVKYQVVCFSNILFLSSIQKQRKSNILLFSFIKS